MPTVKFNYSSWQNIRFHGVIDSDVEREDWDEMDAQGRAEIEGDVRRQLVDLEVAED